MKKMLLSILLLTSTVLFSQAPNITYQGIQATYKVGTPVTLTPTNTGTPPSLKLRAATASGNSNNINYPVDGQAADATYLYPSSVASKADGTLAVADDYGPMVRVIAPNGVSSTIAGKYEVVNGVIQQSFVDGNGANARFLNIRGLAYDAAGNIIVGDTYKVRKVSPTGDVTTIAGSGVAGFADGAGAAAQFKLITSLWIDNQGNIFVTDNFRVRKIDALGNVTSIAGSIAKGNTNGNGAIATFKTMRGITGDNQGNLYVADTENNCIRKIDSANNVTTFAAGINATGICFYNNLLYVCNWMTNQIVTVTTTGTVSVFAGSGIGQFRDGFDNRTSKGASFYNPEGLAINAGGANAVLYVADKSSMKIRKVDYASFAISPDLPSGLSIDGITGVISGTPTKVTPAKLYTVTIATATGYATTMLYFGVN